MSDDYKAELLAEDRAHVEGSELDRLRTELGKAEAVNAQQARALIARTAECEALRLVLRAHDAWHQELGTVKLGDDEVGWHECDMSDAYADSTLCKKTTEALTSTPDRITNMVEALEFYAGGWDGHAGNSGPGGIDPQEPDWWPDTELMEDGGKIARTALASYRGEG